MSPDSELVSAYATERSEAAFQALVQRHVDLVFATALRQVGDRGLAEEITQNVFITLARKSPRLGGMETLAGWLHRTAIFESKTRIRSELRRKRREEVAASIREVEAEGDATLAPLIPLLDEALLHLRESDRMPLVLRYLEERSLREVADVLGIEEDAARKRVSRSLDRLIEFFRKRGFAVSLAVGASLLGSSVKAAPLGLAHTATKAGLAAGGTLGPVQLLLFYLTSLTKTQTVILCALLVVGPLSWQEHVSSQVREKQKAINQELAAAIQKVQRLDADIEQTREIQSKVSANAQSVEMQLAEMNAQRLGKAPPPEYHWDDNSPVVRVPKQFLPYLHIEGMQNRRGELSLPIKELLQFTPEEERRVQDAVDSLLAAYHAELAPKVRQVEATAKDKGNDNEVRVFALDGKSIAPQVKEFRETFFNEVKGTIGKKRFDIFRKSLTYWMRIEDDYRGLSSSMVIFDFDCRLIFTKPQPGDRFMMWRLEKPNGEMMSTSMQLNELPDFIRPAFQDWISLAQSKPVTFPTQ